MPRRTIGVLGLCCAALLAGCTAAPAPPPEVKTVTVEPPSGSAPSPASSSATSTAPGRVFDTAAMRADVAKVLTDTYKLKDVGTVVCPANQAVKDGTTFTCTVPIAGKEKKVPITVTGSDGQYRVDAPA